MTRLASLRFQQARLAELTPILREEDAWGAHPECPVEVLTDGSQVWRVEPGTTVLYLDPRRRSPVEVYLQDPRSPAMVHSEDPTKIWVATCRHQWHVPWTRLRRIGYTPRPSREDQAETAHAGR